MDRIYKIKHLVIDFTDHKVTSNGVEMGIDYKAVEVLKLMVENSGNTVTTDQFMAGVWQDKPSAPEVIPAAIARLRKMFKQAGISDEIIVTVHKVGYRFMPPDGGEQLNQRPTQSARPWPQILLLMLLLSALLASLIVNYKQYTQHADKQLVNTPIQQLNQESATQTTQLYIIRHTEKASDSDENPSLSAAGIERASYWKKVLQHIEFDQVFTTDFIRNVQTAELISTESDIKPELYYPMSFDVVKFLQLVQGQKVLIIGHSNTIPDMVNRLIDETKYPPMSHENYNQLYLITINPNGDTSSSLLHIEKPQ